ncbi:MAG TPA: FUSC family protein [Pseudonocardia sp.]|jgi:uncharacterized membrane protein YccC
MKPWLMLLVIAVAAGLGVLVGLGGATVLAALPAMFCLMAAFGGTLYADLRLLAWFGVALVLVVGGVKTLASVVQPVAIVLVTVLVFVAGMLPVLGPRYITVGMGLGMAASFAYGFQLPGPITPVRDFAAPVVSVAVVLVTRAVLGARDQDAPLRAAIAAVLTGGTYPSVEQAQAQLLADRPRAWTVAAFGGAMRYRNAVNVLQSRRAMLDAPAADELDRLLTAADEQARRLAGLLTAPTPSDPGGRVQRTEPGMPLPGATAALITSMWLGLAAVLAASARRDRTEVRTDTGQLGRDRLRESVRGALTWRSVHLRHAVRCALGMLVALLVSLPFASNPLRMSFLMAVFAIMQPQLQDTIAKAKQRAVGAVAGAAALALLVVLGVPQAALMPIGVVALLAGFLYFMPRNQVAFNACTVLMSVGMNVSMRHLEVGQTMREYLLLIALAVLIGLVFGFVAIPGVRRLDLATRFDQAIGDTAAMLGAVSAALAAQRVDRAVLGPKYRAALGSQQNLTGSAPGEPEPAPDQQRLTAAASDALQGLFASAAALLMRARASAPLAPAVDELARQLTAVDGPAPWRVDDRLPAVIDIEQRLLIDTMIASTEALNQSATALHRP